MENWLLKSKFVAFNFWGLSVLVIAYMNGWMDRLLVGEIAIAAAVLFGVFAIGLAMTAYRVWKVGAELDRLKHGQGRVITVESERALEIRLFSRLSHIQHIANALGLLGLVGTAWGFSLFAANISPDQVGNASSAGALVSTIARGIGVAIYATMLGGLLCLWTTCNLQMLRSATASLCASIMDAARVNARERAFNDPDDRTVALRPAMRTAGAQ